MAETQRVPCLTGTYFLIPLSVDVHGGYHSSLEEEMLPCRSLYRRLYSSLLLTFQMKLKISFTGDDSGGGDYFVNDILCSLLYKNYLKSKPYSNLNVLPTFLLCLSRKYMEWVKGDTIVKYINIM